MEEIRKGNIILESFLSLYNLSPVPPFGQSQQEASRPRAGRYNTRVEGGVALKANSSRSNRASGQVSPSSSFPILFFQMKSIIIHF